MTAEGEKNKLDELIKRCRHGPDVSFVEKVEVKWGEATGEFVRFEIR